jgi:EEF1A lysine methyltransferase 2
MTQTTKKHWNNVYATNEVQNLGWYEGAPIQSLQLIAQCKLDKSAAILDVGAGATTLIDHLLQGGYTNITAVDISEIAIAALSKRLGDDATRVRWIIDDLTNTAHINKLLGVDLWHDRAVLHFLTKESQRQSYFDALREVVKKGGFAIIAAFALDGAKMCSGLNVKNYDAGMLDEMLGDEFTLLATFDYNYQMPSGDVRPFVYTLFRRNID